MLIFKTTIIYFMLIFCSFPFYRIQEYMTFQSNVFPTMLYKSCESKESVTMCQELVGNIKTLAIDLIPK